MQRCTGTPAQGCSHAEVRIGKPISIIHRTDEPQFTAAVSPLLRSQDSASSFRVAEAFNRTRLDAFLSAAMKDASRAKVQAAIREGLVLVNGAAPTKPGHSVRSGDVVTAQLLPPAPVEALPEVRYVLSALHPFLPLVRAGG